MAKRDHYFGYSNPKIFFTIAGMTLVIFGLLTIFLDHILSLEPSLFYVGLIMVILGGAGMFYPR